jgi:hypothetical protein
MTSLCQNPKLIPYLYSILQTVQVASHSKRLEYRVRNERMSNIVPESRLKIGSNIANMVVMNNVDISDQTFSYRNIFDVARNTSHATLRLVFQFELPDPVTTNYEEKNC